MNRKRVVLGISAFLLTLCLGTATVILVRPTKAAVDRRPPQQRTTRPYPNFEVDVLVNGRALSEYFARGRTYIEALPGAEYELRLRNYSRDRVAVALSVDGLNTIDARHTSAWNAAKWVIEPYQTITIKGWQMSSERARHFYFTNERDSYGAKLGQTANLGVISAVFFKERRAVTTITPPYPRPRDRESDVSNESLRRDAPAKAQSGEPGRDDRAIAPRRDDDYAATGIGRNVHHDVRWIQMDLESRSAGEVTIRYEYYSALLRLGIVPRQSPQPYPLQRREDSRGFSPEP